MLKRKVSILIIAALLIVQFVNGMGFLGQANATGTAISGNILTGVNLTVLDASGHTVTNTVYEQGAKVVLDYAWALPNGHGYGNLSTFTFDLPDEFLLSNDITGNLDVDGSEPVGTFKVSLATHKVVMTFNELIENDDVQGILHFETKFDKTQITGSTVQHIDFPINGGTVTVNLNFKPTVTSTIAKKGEPIGYNPHNIYWTVDVNKT